jgi:glycosyltransferase involved in cell wall biosynthesis
MVGPDKGDGSLPKVKELMHELRLGGLVSLPGPIPKTEVPIRLSESDIFLNTADFDNTPVSVLEALACGLVVISTNVGGIPYLLEHGRDALLIPPNDPEALVRAIRLVLHEPDLAATLSENGRRKAEQLDWSAVLPQWKSLLLASAGAGSL